MTPRDYLLSIIEAELPDGFTIQNSGQTGSSENYWVRIAYGRLKETVEFPDVRVEDRDSRRIREILRERIKGLRRRLN